MEKRWKQSEVSSGSSRQAVQVCTCGGTSESFSGSVSSNLVCVGSADGSCRKEGPVSQEVCASWDTGGDLDAWPAGFSSAGT